MSYIFKIADTRPNYQRVTVQASVAAPGKTIVFRNGVAIVVEPSGLVRDLRPGESADSPWCWATPSGDILVYDTADPGQPVNVVMFRLVPA